MFSQKVKRVISILLVISMTLGCNGFSVLAGSVEGVVQEQQVASSEKQTPNYYYEYQEYKEEKIVLLSNEGSNQNGEKEKAKGDDAEPGSVASDNKDGDAPAITDGGSDNGSSSFDAQEKDEEENKKGEEEEPEDDETITTVKEKEETSESVEESESTTETSESEEETTTETSKKDDETESKKVEESESESQTSESALDETESKKVEESESTTETSKTTEESKETSETSESSETSETKVEETTTTVAPEEGETTTAAKETTTTEEKDESESQTTEKSEESQNDETTKASVDDIDDVKNKTVIEFVEASESDAEEVEVIKKYIYATRSIPEDSVWTLKEILANETTGSFRKLPRNEEIAEKYLAKTVKVLVENQYGDQKVVTVPAKWDIEVLSKVYRPEGFIPNANDYRASADGKLYEIGEDGKEKEIKIEEETKDATDKEEDNKVENTDDTKVEETKDTANDVETTEATKDKKEETTEKEVVEPTVKEEINDSDNIEPTIAGFTGTDKENGDKNKEEGKETTEDKEITTEGESGDDDHDASVGGKKVVYEYETVNGDEPITPSEEELKKGVAIVGNANNKVVNSKNAKEEAVAELNLGSLAKSLAELLGGEIMVPHSTGFNDTLFGATDHEHWVCGRAACSDTQRNHFNENMNTTHPVIGVKSFQSVNNAAEFEAAINNITTSDYDYIVLKANITIDKMLKLTKPLFLCINDYTLSFTKDGQLCTFYDYMLDPPSERQHGALTNAICICGCNDGDSDGLCGTIQGTEARYAPAIFYTKNAGVYLFGLGKTNGAGKDVALPYGDTGTGANDEIRIKIKDFTLADAITAYRPHPGQKEAPGDTQVYSYTNNYLYNKNDNTISAESGIDTPMYNDYSSSFIAMTINDKGQAESQTSRQAFFYALDIQDVKSNDGGFANLYYLNSFAMEHCKIRNVGAFRGGIVSADFNNRKFLSTLDTSVNNDYIDIGHNDIQNCELSKSFAGSNANSKWGDEGKYHNGTNVSLQAGETLMDPEEVYSPDKNGLFLLENYNGGSTDESYRIITSNTFENNDLSPVTSPDNAVQQYLIYLTFDSVGTNTINVNDNTFRSNKAGVLYVENLYNEKNNIPATDGSQGIVYLDRNVIENNTMGFSALGTEDRPKTLGVLNFQNLATVLLNTKVTTTTQQNVISNVGIGTGAFRVSNLNIFYVYKTKFNDNKAAQGSGDKVGEGGAIYISTCSTVKIGNDAVNQSEKVEFENNGGTLANIAILNGGAIFARDITSLNISDARFKENYAEGNGGAVYVEGVGRNTNTNIHSSKFSRN